jgi:SAM-dependent methyltransferase
MFNIISTKIRKLLEHSGFVVSKFETPKYHFKPNFVSTHTETLEIIKQNSRVLDLGCNDGSFLEYLKEKKNCSIIGVDSKNNDGKKIDKIIIQDLNEDLPEIEYDQIDYITILDVIEHLNSPEIFLNKLKKKINKNKKIKIIFSTPNVAFLPIRISLLFGNFNYSSKGILDFTHKRLFTFSSFKNFFVKNGFKINKKIGIPAPFPIVLGENILSKFLITLNSFLIFFHKGLFSFQMFYVVEVD